MFKLDEAAEGKFVQNPETMQRPGVVYECHLTCSHVWVPVENEKYTWMLTWYSKLVPFFFSPLSIVHTVSFHWNTNMDLGTFFAEEKVWKLDLQLTETQLLT